MVPKRRLCLNMRGLWAAIIMLCAAGSASALDPMRTIDQYAKESWGKNDGLSQGTVMSLLETSDGYLWLGCRQGLARFDGLGFSTFENDDLGLKQFSFVRDLVEDAEGRLVAAAVGGVIRFDGSAFTLLDENQGLVHPFVDALIAGPSGSLWVGTGGAGVWQLNNRVFEIHPAFKTGNLPVQINDLKEDADGVLWAATGQGVLSLGSTVRQLTTDDGLPSDTTNVLLFDREGALWVGTRGGLVRFVDGDRTVYTTEQGLSHDDVTALLEDRDRNVWIGTADGGLHRFQEGSIESATDGAAHSTGGVFSLFEDRSGALWVGTDQGVEQYRDGAFQTFGRAQGFTEERLLNIEPRKQGGLFVLDASGALYMFENGKASIVAEDGTATGDGMLDLQETDDGSLYIGGPDLLRFRDGKIERFLSPGGDISVIIEDGPSSVLTATTEGNGTSRLYRFENGVFEQLHADVPLFHVQRMRRDKSGRLWIGTSGKGLVRIDSGSARFFTEKDGLPHNVVYETFEDDIDDVWVSTRGGLARIRGNSVTGLVNIENVPSKSPVHIISDGLGFLFITADDGIYRIPISDLRGAADGRSRRVRADIFDISDGLFSVEISWRPSAAALKDGRIYLAAGRGLSVVDPAELSSDNPLPKARIESVTIGNKKHFPLGRIVVKEGRERIQIQYTAPSLTEGDRIRFHYRLDGYEDEWVDAKARRTAEYTNLSPGEYVFEVEGGIAGAFGGTATLTVSIEPRWWETWFARSLFALAVLFALGGLYRLRIRHLTQREKQLGSNVAAVLDIQKGLTLCDIDRLQIRQAVDNLVLNARQVMSDGGRLTVCAKNIDVGEDNEFGILAGNYIEVSISDEGPGVPPTISDRIFDPYFTTKSHVTGLGLAMVRSIVGRQGGAVDATSNEHGGATFRMILKASDSRLPPPVVKIARSSSIPASAYTGVTGAVLVMDDQAYLRNFAKRSLEALGYRVETAKDGTEAIEACRLAMESGNPFDVIVLDLIVQGGMGGAEAVREILAFAPDIRAVAASGYSTSGALFDPKAHGFFSALSKPYTIQSLRAAVDKALR